MVSVDVASQGETSAQMAAMDLMAAFHVCENALGTACAAGGGDDDGGGSKEVNCVSQCLAAVHGRCEVWDSPFVAGKFGLLPMDNHTNVSVAGDDGVGALRCSGWGSRPPLRCCGRR